jgi:hypothetical protein
MINFVLLKSHDESVNGKTLSNDFNHSVNQLIISQFDSNESIWMALTNDWRDPTDFNRSISLNWKYKLMFGYLSKILCLLEFVSGDKLTMPAYRK